MACLEINHQVRAITELIPGKSFVIIKTADKTKTIIKNIFSMVTGTITVNLQLTIFPPNVEFLGLLLLEPQYAFCIARTKKTTNPPNNPERKALH